MSIVLSFLTVIEVVMAVMIIGVILMQRSKSGGGLGAISGGMTEEVFGASAGSFLTRTTVILSLLFLINTLLLVLLQGSITRSKNISIIDSVEKDNIGVLKSPTEPEEESVAEPSAPSEDQASENVNLEENTVTNPTETPQEEPQTPPTQREEGD